ncbi:unnamed protein product [Linum tenue]|uniref:TIR domain-containing protein n=1 Tax=Linum tenue TaxID=586396 RepID=A0AAV0I9Z8_9ROSI|nr:unnamed protein product [Linum tenue]
MAVLLYFLNRSQSSSAKSPLPAGEYEVFLNFRGSDVRYDFADSLHTYLKKYEIRTFFDEEELHKGEEIDSKLLDAIEGSKIYIPIISAKYASSRSPLMELAHMVKCCEKEKGHLILPIFYKVEVGDVKNQRGTFGESFRELAQKHDARTIREWKNALRTVTELKGWTVTPTTRQGVTIDEVFLKVWSHLEGNFTLATDQLIGMDSHVERVMELLELDFNGGASVVGIHGTGGVGKTTIAKVIYNNVFRTFQRYCFLEDVRETLSLKNDGVTTLQSKIIYSILRDDRKVTTASEGIQIIKDGVCPHKVLIILDDVDDQFKFEQILGEVRNFSPGSRFIITARDKRVLELLQVSKLHEVGGLSHDHSLQLLRLHAFRVDIHCEDKTTLCEEFVKAAAGLPLTLEVIGSLLFRRDRKFWEAKLKELEGIPYNKLQEILKISYDELSGSETQILLDIASVSIGKSKALPFYMWRDCNFNPDSGICTLILRSLIKVDGDNKFWMHDHVRELGRMIIREGDDQHLWKRTRIWSNEDAV